MRAILRYTECLQDGKNIFRVLARQNVDILRTKQKYFSIYPEITVLVSSRQELNKILDELNQHCTYEVQLVETQASVKCDFCKRRDCCSKIKKFFAFFCDDSLMDKMKG